MADKGDRVHIGSLIVCVTGASGFVASHVVKQLLEDGYTVRATVRDPSDESKVKHLKEIAEEVDASDRLRFFSCDLLEEGSFDEAVDGADNVIHLAGPFKLNGIKDAQKDLLDPMVKGTENVLRSVNKADSVRRVILTSAVGALYGQNDEKKGPLDENDWNKTSSLKSNPFNYAKKVAEERAWEMVKEQSRWDLVTILPGFVVGPNISGRDCQSQRLLKLIMTEAPHGIPNVIFGFVDVRDVARAHIAAMEEDKAYGRYIVAPEVLSFREIADMLKPNFEGFPIPSRTIPKPLMYVVGPLMMGMSMECVRHYIDVPISFKTDKIQRELNFQFSPVEKALNDMAQSMIDNGIISQQH